MSIINFINIKLHIDIKLSFTYNINVRKQLTSCFPNFVFH